MSSFKDCNSTRKFSSAIQKELKEKFEDQEQKIIFLEKSLDELCQQSPMLVKKRYMSVETYTCHQYEYHKPKGNTDTSENKTPTTTTSQNGCAASCGAVFVYNRSDVKDDDRISMSISELKDSYSKQFTVHGLSRVCMGKRFERLIWGLFLLAAFAFSGYLLYSLYSRFMRREVYTKVEFVHEKRIKLPTISLCSRKYLEKCSVYPIYPPALCRKLYQNRLNLRSCQIGDLTAHSSRCEAQEYWKHDEGCLLINPEGNLEQTSPGIDFGLKLEVSVNTTSDIQLRIHDSDEPPEDEAYGQYRIINSTYLDLQMNVERIKRLASPFNSNCTDGHNLRKYFNTEGYSVVSCRRVCRIFKLLETCGIVFPQPFRGIPQSVVKKYRIEVDNSSVRYAYHTWSKCWTKNLEASFNSSGECNCPPACDEIRYTYIPRDQSMEDRNSSTKTIKMDVYFNTMQYTVWQEVPAYGIEQMIAEFGGLLGLLIGASVLSLLEVMVYCGLSLFQRVYRFLYM